MKKLLLAFAAVVLVAAAIFLFPLLDDYRKSVVGSCVVYIPSGSSYTVMLDSLAGAVGNMDSFRKVAARYSLEENFKAGRYRITPENTNKDIVRMLRYGWENPMRLTLSGNIRTLERLSGILGRRLDADSADFMAFFSNPDVWKGNGFTGETFMSMFIPNTYEVYWTVSPEKFVGRMKDEYDRFWGGERRAKAERIGLSPVEVSILASIVCEETNHTPEMPRIAGVYMNRLKKGMKLDADPTVKFALGDPSIKRILLRHLEVDSPYNTYRNTGLPPGPITIPSVRGIDAVLDYEHHNYLYFCANASMDGTHKFATTLAEHNRNAREYQAALNRLKIR